MRCVPAGIARPAGREARSPPVQQAPFPASSHPVLQCVPVSPPSLSSRRPHHLLIIQPRERSAASLPSSLLFLQRAAEAGALPPQPLGRGEAAPLLSRAPPCRRWAISNQATRTAPQSPRPGGARGPGGRGGDMM